MNEKDFDSSMIATLYVFFILLVVLDPLGCVARKQQNGPERAFWLTIEKKCPDIIQFTDSLAIQRSRILGHGIFGTVFPARYLLPDTTTVQHGAVKLVRLQSSVEGIMIASEACNMYQLKGAQNIAQIIGISLISSEDAATYPMAALVMKEYGQNLGQVEFPINSYQLVNFLKEAALAVKSVHGAKLMHLDIRPENFLLKRSPGHGLVLTDFGLSRRSREVGVPGLIDRFAAWMSDRPGRLGDPTTMAPELLKPLKKQIKRHYGSVSNLLKQFFRGNHQARRQILQFIEKEGTDAYPRLASDIFSLGVVFYKMATGSEAFPIPIYWEDDKGRVFAVPQHKDYELGFVYAITRNSKLPQCPDDMDVELCGLIHWMLHPDYKKRPTIHQVLNHPFFGTMK